MKELKQNACLPIDNRNSTQIKDILHTQHNILNDDRICNPTRSHSLCACRWDPWSGARKPGRPATKWTDDMKKHLKKDGPEQRRNRDYKNKYFKS